MQLLNLHSGGGHQEDAQKVPRNLPNPPEILLAPTRPQKTPLPKPQRASQDLLEPPQDLGDVDLGALGARHHHGLEVVVLGEGLLGGGARLVAGVVEDAVDLVLEGLPQGVARGGLQLVVVGLLDDLSANPTP